MDRFLTWVIEFADRNQRTIDILSGAWLVFSLASWIPFIPIPEIPYVTDDNFWIASTVWNVVWWSFAHPQISAHRSKMALENADKT